MIFQVVRNGKPLGEFTETMMNHKLYAGELQPNDLYRAEGMSNWREMSQYGASAQTAPPLRVARGKFFSAATHPAISLVIDLPSALGFLGSLILLLGIFAPAASIPLLGSVNYIQNGHWSGVILIVTGLVSATLTAVRYFKGLWVTGGLTILCLLGALIFFKYEIGKMKTSAGPPDKMFADLISAAADAVQLEWGIGLLFLGGTVLLVAAAIGTGIIRISR